MMDRSRWQDVRDLFERAVDERPADINAWLDAAGVDDWRLREEVMSLIRHHSSAGAFLASPASDQLPALLSTDQPLEPSRVLGQYTIVRELGRGGMGRVYLAKDGRLGRMVALKAVSSAFTLDSSHRDRLRREAHAAANLAHPGICTVYALEEIDGDVFLATEFVEGRTLRDEIRSGVRPSTANILQTARELAAALAHAHSRGVVHRDLKPENLMRTAEGHIKILDFGLARIDAQGRAFELTSEPVLTEAGTVLGTPRYMAPEQLMGLVADARADVFAAGIVLYEYACGTHPFDAPTPLATAGRILESDAPRAQEQCPDLPRPLAAVIDRCLRKLPENRFASGAEILRALEKGTHAEGNGRLEAWWRAHQLVVIALYLVACGVTWQAKEWRPGVTTVIFIAVCVTATVAGVFRGHLLFTGLVNRPGLVAERRRVALVTIVADLLIALGVTSAGITLAFDRPVAAVLTIGLAIGIALARLIVEPTTTSASFDRT
jgi:predicted Ser/Thr protein kinase